MASGTWDAIHKVSRVRTPGDPAFCQGFVVRTQSNLPVYYVPDVRLIGKE